MPSLAAAEAEAAYAASIGQGRAGTVSGADLRVGDVIEVWWAPNRDTIIGLRPYTGPLAHLWPHGAMLADFAQNKCGMTIGCADIFRRIA